MTDELVDTVQEVRSTNRFILKRLNQLYRGEECPCFKNHETQLKEISELRSKVSELQNALEQSESARSTMCGQLESLSEKVDSLETLFLNVQTGDSKLQSASIRKTQKSTSEKPSAYGNAKSKQNGESERLSNDNEGTDVKVAHVSGIKFTNPKLPNTVTNVPKDKPSAQEVSHKNEDLQNGAVGGIQKRSSNIASKISLSKESVPTKERRSDTSKSSGSDNITGNNPGVEQSKVEVLHDPNRRTYRNEQYWRFLAQQEVAGAADELKDLDGDVHSVICLDISASMAEGTAWKEANIFLHDFLTGLETMSPKCGLPSNESLAFVTFGHKTEVQQRFTKKYDKVRDLIGKQKLGGPSPVYGGLAFALAAAASAPHRAVVINGVPIHTKIILITDGHVTEVGQYGGPDTCDGNLDETQAKILQLMEELRDSRMETFIVPVGDANLEFLNLMSAFDGKLLDHKSGTQLSRRVYLTTKVRMMGPLGLFKDVDRLPELLMGGSDITADDRKTMQEIREGAQKHLRERGKSSKNMYREFPNKNLAPIGSRVRRGPDWSWNTQDSNGPGTVIGHDHGDQVWVEWDVDNHQNVYRYGDSNYDVLIVEEPRTLPPGQSIAVGCIVKPRKKDFLDRRGVVIKLENTSNKVTVRWKDADKNEEVGRNEVEVCAGFQPFQSEGNVLGFDETTPTPAEKKPTKNKNKNIN